MGVVGAVGGLIVGMMIREWLLNLLRALLLVLGSLMLVSGGLCSTMGLYEKVLNSLDGQRISYAIIGVWLLITALGLGLLCLGLKLPKDKSDVDTDS